MGALVISLNAPRTYDPVGRCIYCDETRYSVEREPLACEHIIPEGLGGRLALEGASCGECEGRINPSETFCQNRMLEAFRYRLNIRQKKRARPQTRTMPIDFLFGSVVKRIKIDLKRYPTAFLVPLLPPPEFISPFYGPRSNVIAMSLVRFDPTEWERIRIQKRADGVRGLSGKTRFRPFIVMLAKIAHSFAVAEHGLGTFHPLLLPIIRGDLNYPADYLIGCTSKATIIADRYVVRLDWETHLGVRVLVGHIQIFGDCGFPEYAVVVGCHLDDTEKLELPTRERGYLNWRLPRIDLEAPFYGERPMPTIYMNPKTDGQPDGIGDLEMTLGVGPDFFVNASPLSRHLNPLGKTNQV